MDVEAALRTVEGEGLELALEIGLHLEEFESRRRRKKTAKRPASSNSNGSRTT